jgi:hypothetical protein
MVFDTAAPTAKKCHDVVIVVLLGYEFLSMPNDSRRRRAESVR